MGRAHRARWTYTAISVGDEPVEARRATIEVDSDEQTLDVWLRLPEGSAEDAEARCESALRDAAKGYRIAETPGAETRSFDLRRGLGAGMRFAIWTEGSLLRVSVKVEGRLDTLWALSALASGATAWLVGSTLFCLGMSPHVTITRHAGKVGVLLGLLTTLVVALATWPPLRIVTRRTRRESFEDARRLLDAVLASLERHASG